MVGAFLGLVIGGVVTAVKKNFIDMFQNGFSVVKDISPLLLLVLSFSAHRHWVAGVVAAIVFAVANLVIVIKEHWTEIVTFLSGL